MLKVNDISAHMSSGTARTSTGGSEPVQWWKFHIPIAGAVSTVGRPPLTSRRSGATHFIDLGRVVMMKIG